MKSLLFAVIAAGTISFAAPTQGADIYVYPPARRLSATRTYYRGYNTPLPTYRFQPSYRPYAQGGRQGGGYTYGFPWTGGY